VRNELKLSVKCRNFRGKDEFISDKRFSSQIKSFVKERDKGACHYCGDVFEQYQEIHHIDNDHQNNDQSNLMTICSLCHGCHHIGFAGIKNRGIIVYMPEVSQEEINHTQKFLMAIGQPKFHAFGKFTARMEPYIALDVRWDTPDHTPLLGSVIKERARVVEEEYSQGWSNPALLGEALLGRSDREYDERHHVLKDLRLIPVVSGFPKQVDYWLKEFTKRFPLKSWDGLLEENKGQLTNQC